MGLFSKTSKVCDICGRSIGATKKLEDGVVCWSCLTLAGYDPKKAAQLSMAEVRPKAEKINRAIAATKSMPVDLQLQDLYLDTVNRQWYCQAGLLTGTGSRCLETLGVYPMSDLKITWVESYTVSATTSTTTNNGMKRAIIGGILAGSTGAVIGAVTANQSTTGQSVSQEHFHVHLQFKNEPKDYWVYMENVNEVNCMLRYFAQIPTEEAQSPESPADELRKYKALLDDGIITQQDFDAKKKQLLGL